MSKFVRVLLVASTAACSTSVVGAAADLKVDPTDILQIEKAMETEFRPFATRSSFGNSVPRTPLRFSTTSSLTAAPPATAIWSLPLGPRPLPRERAYSLFPRIRLRAATSARPLQFLVQETVEASCSLTYSPSRMRKA